MNEQLKVISRFKESISWANETETYRINRSVGNIYYLQHEKAIYFPCHWQEFDNKKRQVWGWAKMNGRRPCLLIWGEPDSYIAERIWRHSFQIVNWIGTKEYSLICIFIDPIAQITINGLLLQNLDGVDWNRTLTNGLQEKSPRLIMEWD
ncbi:MAG: hypothetical protein ACRC8K_23640 [Waterburya sp.]